MTRCHAPKCLAAATRKGFAWEGSLNLQSGPMRSGVLSPKEIFDLTGYSQPSKQVEALISRGFTRTYRDKRSGRVVVERCHFEAVCRGEYMLPHRGTPSERVNLSLFRKKAED